MRAFFAHATTRVTQWNRKVPTSMVKPISISCRGQHSLVQASNFLPSGNRRTRWALWIFQRPFLGEREAPVSEATCQTWRLKLCDVVHLLRRMELLFARSSRWKEALAKPFWWTQRMGWKSKIPCPNAGRAIYSTASEAAVLQYGMKSFLIIQGIQN